MTHKRTNIHSHSRTPTWPHGRCAPPWGNWSVWPDDWPFSRANFSAALEVFFGRADAAEIVTAVEAHYGPLPPDGNATEGGVNPLVQCETFARTYI